MARRLSILAAMCLSACSDEYQLPPLEAVDASLTPPGADASFDAQPDVADAARPVEAGVDAAFAPSKFDVNHLLGTGQSLSVGYAGTPTLSTTQPFDNRRFVTGVIAGGSGLTSFVPLTEAGTETLSSSLANFVRAGAAHRMLVSAHGVSGIAYSGIKKGTTAYANGLAQVSAAKALCTSQKLTYVVRGVTNVHGESDHLAGNTAYASNLAQWQQDYETDVRAITAQTEPVPMFHTQMSSWTKYGQATSAIPAQQLMATVGSGGKLVLVGAKYHLPYAPDGVHLTNQGYRQMGEDYAKAYRRVVLEGQRWEPLRPTSVTRNANVIRIVFAVPSPPVAFDTSRVAPAAHMGFEYTDASGSPPAIASVALDGPDAVKIVLASTPTGANKRVRYAFTGVPGASAGPMTGPRGNLRDSDATPSPHGYSLYNWAVHFDEAVQ